MLGYKHHVCRGQTLCKGTNIMCVRGQTSCVEGDKHPVSKGTNTLRVKDKHDLCRGTNTLCLWGQTYYGGGTKALSVGGQTYCWGGTNILCVRGQTSCVYGDKHPVCKGTNILVKGDKQNVVFPLHTGLYLLLTWFCHYTMGPFNIFQSLMFNNGCFGKIHQMVSQKSIA